ncbi:MAG TPA: hypothetical protein VGJ20_40685 [Xanthobacteraceae bacterium]|jgi:hypothetical protein
MSRLAIMAMLGLIFAFNLIALTVNVSGLSSAAVRRMSYQELMGNRDFVRAVRSIAESCTVNVDIGKLKC